MAAVAVGSEQGSPFGDDFVIVDEESEEMEIESGQCELDPCACPALTATHDTVSLSGWSEISNVASIHSLHSLHSLHSMLSIQSMQNSIEKEKANQGNLSNMKQHSNVNENEYQDGSQDDSQDGSRDGTQDGQLDGDLVYAMQLQREFDNEMDGMNGVRVKQGSLTPNVSVKRGSMVNKKGAKRNGDGGSGHDRVPFSFAEITKIHPKSKKRMNGNKLKIHNTLGTNGNGSEKGNGNGKGKGSNKKRARPKQHQLPGIPEADPASTKSDLGRRKKNVKYLNGKRGSRRNPRKKLKKEKEKKKD